MSNNKRMSWQNLSSDERRKIYLYLKTHLAGAAWYYSQLHSVPDEYIKPMKFRLICQNLHRSFRYLILNETIHGTRLGSYGKEQRLKSREFYIALVTKEIADETGVSFEKVHTELMRRMKPYFD